MASQSSYIKRSPPSLQPSAGGAAGLPSPRRGSGDMRGPGRERSPALCPLPCDSLFLSDARILSPNSTQRFFGKISQFGAFDFSLSLALVCACACSPLLLRQSVRGLCAFKGSEMHRTRLKLLPDRYFRNELDVAGVTRQRLKQCWMSPAPKQRGFLVTFAVGQVVRAFSAPHHEEDMLSEVKFFGCRTATSESHSLPESEDNDLTSISCAARGVSTWKLYHEQRNGAVWLTAAWQ